MLNHELWLSYRYLTAKKDRFLSIINWVSIIGVAIGVAALIVVIGVMAGFTTDLRNKIIGTNAHIMIEKPKGVNNFEEVRQAVLDNEGIKGTAPYVHGSVFLETPQRAADLILRGVDPRYEASVTKINEYLLDDRTVEALPENGLIIGSQLARHYGYRVGDEVVLIAPASGVAGDGWRYPVKIHGIFDSGMYDFDMKLVLVHIKKSQQIFHFADGVVTGVAVKLHDVFAAPEIKVALMEELGFSYMIRTWIESNRSFFAALKLEKLAMYIILTLIVIVASFNIISTLIVTVTSKVKDIGILKSIGVTKRSIRRIFMMQGLSLGIIGTFWGLVFGGGICYVIKYTDLIKLPEDIYYIDRLPVLIQASDILIIVASALTISFCATIYPARKAANMEPVAALRYE